MKDQKVSFLPLLFLFVQPIFMTGNIAVARGAAGLVPPVSLAFWRWVLAALILLPFIYPSLKKQWKDVLIEFPKLLVLGLTGFAFAWAQQTFGIIGLGIPNALIDAYPIKMELMDFVWTSIVVLTITTLASIIPARKAVEMTFKQ